MWTVDADIRCRAVFFAAIRLALWCYFRLPLFQSAMRLCFEARSKPQFHRCLWTLLVCQIYECAKHKNFGSRL